MSFCAGCIDLKELPGAPQGSTKEIGGVTTYVAEGSKAGTIVMALDIYGLGITNPKIVADKFAKETGFTVYAPDYFKGKPIKPEDFELPSTASSGPPSEEKMGKNFEAFMGWMKKDHGPENTLPLFKAVIKEAAKNGKVGAVGYCYGSKIAVMAAQEKLIQGAALYHPSMLEPEDADKVDVPVILNMAELDPLFNGELKETWQSKLKAKSLLDDGSAEYPNTVHGFGCRPDVNDAQVKAAWEKSIAATSAFFTKVLA